MQDEKFADAARMLCDDLQYVLGRVPGEYQAQVTEIRLRADRPLCLMQRAHALFVASDGSLYEAPGKESVIVSSEDLRASFLSICGWAVHTHQRELTQGYIAVRGGHRAGVAGTAAIENGEVKTVRAITSLNLRIAREIYGAADEILERCFRGKRLGGILIAGSPASGKTTILRDLARQMASGKSGRFYKVCVVDESGEIGASFSGILGHDLGVSTDLLSGYPKAQGLEIAVRYLSPEILICDEIATWQEIRAVEAAANCGVTVITSIHAGSFEELNRKRQLKDLMNTGAFTYIAILSGAEKPAQLREIRQVDNI